MKFIKSIFEFFSTLLLLFKGKSVEKKEEQRKEQIKQVETFHKDTVKNIEKGKIDDINKKLRF